MNINGYLLKSELKNANSGFSKWGFALKDGKEYFIKELINPVYPIDRSMMDDALFEQRREFCNQYENKFKYFFEKINNAGRGNLVRINEFFRYGSRYYLVTDKIEYKPVSVEYISSLSEEKKQLLLKTLAHCFYDLHSAGIVHFDVKPANILVKSTPNGNYTAKVIDFDSGFLKGTSLDSDDMGGDLTYIAPETFLGICGEKGQIDEKADIFALGLVFHEYYCGKLPYYDKTEYEYPYEAALDSGVLLPDMSILPNDLAKLIISMLDVNPEKRPSAKEVIVKLNEITNTQREKAQIDYLEIYYSTYYDKAVRKRIIILTKDEIRYRNLKSTKTEEFPDFFFEPKEKKVDCNNITNAIYEAGLFDIATPKTSLYESRTMSVEGLVCICSNGVKYEYCAPTLYSSEFKQIIDILEEYCDFPEYICIPEPKTEPVKNDADWFKPAGDL